MNLGYDFVQVLVGQETLLQAFVQEIGVMGHDLVDGLASAQLLFQFVVVGLKDFNLHVVHVVLAKLEHAMTQGICLLQGRLDIALFGSLML